MHNKQSKFQGFTLIELMITLAVAAILLSMAAPSFTSAIQNNRLTTQANEFVTFIHVARSEAIKRGARITMCKSANGSSCITTGSWAQGWILFVDSDDDAVVDASEDILRIHEALEGNNTLTGKNGSVSNYISYIDSGFVEQIDGNLQFGEIILCDNRGFGDRARAIEISASGRVKTTDATDASITAVAC